MRGLYIGRFQPFHMGHLHAVNEALEVVDELVIAIGSSQHDHEHVNPFTAGERGDMILSSIKESHRIILAQIPDVNDYGRWMKVVDQRCPSYDILFTHSELTTNLARKEGVKVHQLEHFKKEQYNGTLIRNEMKEGGPWESKVPAGTQKVLASINGVERVKKANDMLMAVAIDIVETVACALKEKKMTVSIAESCTGGLLAKRLTDIPGSSEYFKGTVVAYSNEVKTKLLNVSTADIQKYGAVSDVVSKEMALNIKTITSSDIGISITGIAGPTGGDIQPIGTIYYTIAIDEPITDKLELKGTRQQIRWDTTTKVLEQLLKMLI